MRGRSEDFSWAKLKVVIRPDMFVLARPIWMLLNPRQNSKGERHRQKETFSAMSKPPPPLPPHPPLWGNHRQGRAEGCCFLFTQALCYPGSLLGPPVPSSPPTQRHNNNLPIWCNQTFSLLFIILLPFFLSSLSCDFALPSPYTISLFCLIPSLLQSQPHPAFHLPHYPPPTCLSSTSPPVASRTPAGRYWSA